MHPTENSVPAHNLTTHDETVETNLNLQSWRRLVEDPPADPEAGAGELEVGSWDGGIVDMVANLAT